MNLIKREGLFELARKGEGPCISIYLPVEPANGKKNLILFKDLVRDAERQLLEGGMSKTALEGFMTPIRPFVANPLFWSHVNGGFALFMAKDIFRTYDLPYGSQPVAVVSGRFYIKPLIPLFTANAKFYVLAASQNRLRLFQATRQEISEVRLEGAPSSTAEITKYEAPEELLQFRTRTAQGGAAGRREAMFFGEGVGREFDKDIITEYFKQIGEALDEYLKDERAPLVFAGVDYLFPILKDSTKYEYVADSPLLGNPDYMNDKELHEKAWAVVEPVFLKAREEALSQFMDFIGTGRASTDLQRIIPNAVGGLVDTLFVSTGEERWGRFDEVANAVRLEAEKTPESEDLLDFAAVHTIIKNGRIFAVEKDTLPGGAAVGAIFRF